MTFESNSRQWTTCQECALYSPRSPFLVFSFLWHGGILDCYLLGIGAITVGLSTLQSPDNCLTWDKTTKQFIKNIRVTPYHPLRSWEVHLSFTRQIWTLQSRLQEEGIKLALSNPKMQAGRYCSFFVSSFLCDKLKSAEQNVGNESHSCGWRHLEEAS